MKSLFFIWGICFLLVMGVTSCKQTQSSGVDSDSCAVDSCVPDTCIVDSCKVDSVLYTKVQGEKCEANYHALIQYLRGGNLAQVDFVNKLIALLVTCNNMTDSLSTLHGQADVNACFQQKYPKVTTLDVEDLVRQGMYQYFASYKQDVKDNDGPLNYGHEVSTILTPLKGHIMTLQISTYMYLSGAHGGMAWDFYNIDMDNMQLLYFDDIFKKGAEKVLRPIIVNELCKYFEVPKGELKEQLLIEEDIDELPLPQTTPLLTPQGVLFQYQQYEICCYAAGAPQILIPYDKIQNILQVESCL